MSAVLGAQSAPGLRVGIGDDAAAWDPSPGSTTVATADVLVEGVHFDLATTSWRDLGWKALAENVSDVAAMGCQPRYALISLTLADAEVGDVEDLYRGLAECANRFGCVVVGGDVVRGPCLLISVALVGESLPAEPGRRAPLLMRSTAVPGDRIAVSGPLGASAAGLRVLQSARPMVEKLAGPLRAAHTRPMPKVEAGLALVRAGVRCAIDVSDGLVADIGHICEQSGVHAEIEIAHVPVAAEAEECFGNDALAMALSGGEDYQLACAGPPPLLAKASELLVAQGEPPLIEIGRVVAAEPGRRRVRLVGPGSERVASVGAGWDHFGAVR